MFVQNNPRSKFEEKKMIAALKNLGEAEIMNLNDVTTCLTNIYLSSCHINSVTVFFLGRITSKMDIRNLDRDKLN